MGKDEVIEILTFCQPKRNRKEAKEYFEELQRYQIKDMVELAKKRDTKGFKEYIKSFTNKKMQKYCERAVKGFENLKLDKEYYK